MESFSNLFRYVKEEIVLRMRAYLLVWDGKHFPLSFMKMSPGFASFA
jgi:hypothetical protein